MALDKHDTHGDNVNYMGRQLMATKVELQEIYDYKVERLILTSSAGWVEEGEKRTKYFLNLQSGNRNKKTIKQLQTRNNSYTTDPKEILKIRVLSKTIYTENKQIRRQNKKILIKN